jgi:hypothetical protein
VGSQSRARTAYPPAAKTFRHLPGLRGCPMNGGLRKRAHSYLNVPSTTVNDGRLSFKARGILAYLLDKPAGWDVRSVAIAADSPDGKAAVQAGLRELARAGYYRIERRRLLDGRLVTGTAVSEEPVTSWAAEYAEYQGPVPVVQQPDGCFRVQRKDGSLTGDGFIDMPALEPGATETAGDSETGGDGDGDISAGRTGTQFSGAGLPGTGLTGAGSAGAGKPGAFISTEEPLQRTNPLLPPPPPLRPAALAGAREGEDSEDHDSAPGLEALVAEVRAIRPEWSSASIRRALVHPDIAERGWCRARPAMLAVAADPQSRQPGRLSHDGPWWNLPASGLPPDQRPPWCGRCSDERRRQVDVGGKPARCPRDLIRERTLDGLRAAEAHGRRGGRPVAVNDDVLAVARARQSRGESVTAIARHLKIGRSTLYRALQPTERDPAPAAVVSAG